MRFQRTAMVDPRCVDYIRSNKDRYPLEALKQSLAQAGISSADIEEAVRLAAQPAAPTPPPVFSASPAPATAPSLAAGLSSMAGAVSSALAPAAQRLAGAAAALTAAPAASSGPSSEYSHPDAAVRHSYPLAVTGDGFGEALSLCLKTTPIIGLRLGLLVGFTVVAIVWFVMTLVIAGFVARASGGLGLIAYMIGIGAPAGVFYWFKRYVLCMLEMAHVAVLTRLITHGELEAGKDQLAYGKEMVVARFGEINLLLVLQGLVSGVVGSFMRTVDWLAGLLPIPGMGGAINAFNQVMSYATRYVDDAIFSYNLARGDANPWRSSKDGLIYYAQNWRPVIKTAVWAFLLEHGLSFLGFWLLLVPCLLVFGRIPHLGGWGVMIAILFAVNFKSAVLRPLFSTMVMLSYHKAIHQQPINLEFDQTLTSVSRQFQTLSERARDWVAGHGQPQPARP